MQRTYYPTSTSRFSRLAFSSSSPSHLFLRAPQTRLFISAPTFTCTSINAHNNPLTVRTMASVTARESNAIKKDKEINKRPSSFKLLNRLQHADSITTFEAVLLGEQVLLHIADDPFITPYPEPYEGGQERWNARLESRLLLCAAMGNISHASLLARRYEPLSQSERDAFLRNLKKRSEGMPISYVTGTKEFWGLEFEVNPNVLIPRPDSETLIETCVGLYKPGDYPRHILDLGTGSGCLLIALLKEFPKAKGIGTDICKESLALARRNQEKLDVPTTRGAFVECDWLEVPKHALATNSIGIKEGQSFQLVVSNPPYVPDGKAAPDVATYEPARALFGGADGLNVFRHFATTASLPDVLEKGGHLVLEIGKDQAEPIRDMFSANSSCLRFKQCTRDFSGIERCLVFERV